MGSPYLEEANDFKIHHLAGEGQGPMVQASLASYNSEVTMPKYTRKIRYSCGEPDEVVAIEVSVSEDGSVEEVTYMCYGYRLSKTEAKHLTVRPDCGVKVPDPKAIAAFEGLTR